MKKILVLSLAVSLAICGGLYFLLTDGAGKPTSAMEKQRGVNWVAGPRPVSVEDFQPLLDAHVDWIVQTPFAWQGRHDSPDLRLITEGVMWGETDGGIETTARLARQRGIKTLLKPHVWVTERGVSVIDIAMKSETDWQRWFENYRAFILHYVRLAEQLGIEALCIGTELQGTTKLHDAEWRKLIKDIRTSYQGRLTYAANWYKEFEEVEFWSELDFIGVQAYFPLAHKDNPSLEELNRGWLPHLAAIEKVQKLYRKPVLFTEIGYRSIPGCAQKPWEWPEHNDQAVGETGLQTQANCYEAFFQTFWDREWFSGAYFWKWYPSSGNSSRSRDGDFTPQNKPAEAVMKKWYAQARRQRSKARE